MKSFKTHLSLILPLLFLMFAFEFIFIINQTLKHYETLLNERYSIIIASTTSQEQSKLKAQIPSISELKSIDIKEFMGRLKNNLSANNLATLEKNLPKFYKISLNHFPSQSELINAKSTLAAQLIAKNLSGKFGELLEKIRTDLVKTLAFVETCIDYADDDLPDDILEQTRVLYKENARILRQIATISKSKKGLIEGFKIAIIGKANVGKSSLLNALLAKNRAIVSDTAGTTRDRVEDELKIGTHLVRIIDTAGIRHSDDKVEQIGVKLSLAAIKEADIIIAVFDSSRERDSEDTQIFQLLKKSEQKIFFVLNKTDLKAKFNAPKGYEFIKICTKNSLSPLQNALSHYLDSLDSEDFIISNAVLIDACERASEAIERASELLSEQNLELFAFECHQAINEIAKFTREFENDEVLDEMFGNFCLGK